MGAGRSVGGNGNGTAAQRPSLSGLKAKSALVLGDYGLPHHVISRTGALFAMQDTRWDHALKVTADGTGLVGHAGAVLLRKLADQAGLTGRAGRGAGADREVPAGRPGCRAGLDGGRRSRWAPPA